MPIVQSGSLNTTALIVPDLYVQIVTPQNLLVNGVPTNVLGLVGTANWGPINQPLIVGSMAQYAAAFGPLQNRKYDMGTAAAIAVQQGANNFRCVRVTDGTDAKATLSVVASCLTATALYSGTLGNSITVAVAAGSKASSWKIIVGVAGYQAEVFDNITGSGNAFWVAAAAAINNGNSVLRGPSNYITASAGAGTTAASATSVTLAGGTDGVATITASVLVGSDTSRTGMYALRGQGCSIAMLADADDSTQWAAIDTFGLSEGIYMMQVIPSGTSVSAAVTAKNGAALDSYATKILHGDWIYWNDQVNAVIRLVSPQAFAAGRLANLSPERSSLNKPVYGVIGTQKSGVSTVQNTAYSAAELQSLIGAGIDVICAPQPGGNYFGLRAGHNSSSNASINGDNYTRLTNYIASTLSAGMGLYVGALINADLFGRVRATLMNFLGNMMASGQLGSTDGTLPYSVVCDPTNNPASQTGLGYVTASVQVRYQAINEKFIVNVEGGQTVNVLRQQASFGNAPATPVI